MIGTLPMKQLAPLEYRYALDAAMSMLASKQTPIICCQVPALRGEVDQRLPKRHAESASAALWIEPMVENWQAELETLSTRLSQNADLLIIASRPLARLLPERKGWPGEPLAIRWRGKRQLCRALRQAGFVLTEQHGFHSYESIVLNTLSQQATRRGYAALADRLHFAARLRYCRGGQLASFATVVLLMASRGKR